MTRSDIATNEVERVCDRAKHELLDLVLSQATESEETTPSSANLWMTAEQLSTYWQLVDGDGKPRTAGILKWTKRRPGEFPLPHAYMGDLLRFYREDVDKWAKEEAERRRIQNERKRLKIA